MSGKGKEMKTEQLPLMTKQQENIFNQMLSGMFAQMQGFPLGQAYGGPVESSYSPMPFMGFQGPRDASMPQGNRPGRLREDIREQRGRREAPGGRGMEGGGAYDATLPSILDSMGPDQGLIPQPNAMTELLTSPFIDPFRQGMTGNYPRGGGLRR